MHTLTRMHPRKHVHAAATLLVHVGIEDEVVDLRGWVVRLPRARVRRTILHLVHERVDVHGKRHVCIPGTRLRQVDARSERARG